MPRLVAFGCSITYGQFLSDNLNNEKPSDYAYPALIAKRLNLEIVNNAVIASGNLQILLDVLNFEFFPTDRVIIGWSYFSRYDKLQFTDYLGNTDILSMHSIDHKRAVLEELYGVNKYYDYNNFFKNWLVVHHAHSYLSSKKIINHGVRLGFDNHPHTMVPKYIKELNFLNINLKFIDFAQDSKHPGQKTHEYYAEQLYNYITTEVSNA